MDTFYGVDPDTGLPSDKSYLERGLPVYLQESLERFLESDRRAAMDSEYTLRGSCWMELNTCINVAETDQSIDSERAWHLREKYLGMERSNCGSD